MNNKNLTIAPNHKEAAYTLRNVVVWNSPGIPNSVEAAKILADKLGVSRTIPSAWFRGAFKKHPVSPENFLRFVIAYQGKRGIKTNKDIINLAMNLYGVEYEHVLSLIEIWPEKEKPNFDWQILGPKSHFSASFQEDLLLLGALPKLSYYNLEVFQSLWRLPEYLLLEKLALLEKRGFIICVNANRWKIDTATLGAIKNFFISLLSKQRKEANGWGMRMLKRCYFLDAYKKEFTVKLSDLSHILDRSANKRLRKSLGIGDFVKYPYGERLKMTCLYLGNYDADWDILQTYQEIMRPEQFLRGLFLQLQWKKLMVDETIVFFFGFFAALGLCVFHIYPYESYMSALVAFGWYIRIYLYLLKIDRGWISLWEEILPIIRKK